MVSLPTLNVRGTHQEVGMQIGETFSDNVHKMINDWVVRPGLVSLQDSVEGRRLVSTFLETSTKVYPQYVKEIEGIATGAGVDFMQGVTFRSVIRQMIEDWVDRPGKYALYESEEGKSLVDKYFDTSRSVYPSYMEEVEGIAAGAEVDFLKLFLAHIADEIDTSGLNSATPNGPSGSCTDLILLNSNEAVVVHTEDNAPDVADSGYMIEATVTSSSGSQEILEEFVAYCYPGLLPGTAFNVNKYGICSSLNVFQMNRSFAGGMPRRFVSRALLSAKSVEEARSIAERGPGIAFGINFNLAWKSHGGENNICSMELAGIEKGTIVLQTHHTGFGCQFNNYKFLGHFVDVSTDPSSVHRYERIRQISQESAPTDKSALLAMISDVSDPAYPIYRNGRPPDRSSTAAIAVFDLNTGVFDVYKGKPTDCRPVHSYSISDLKRLEPTKTC